METNRRFEMSELWELDVNSSPQKTIIYGDAKTGKTQLAATLAAKYNLHWFDFENGYKTLLKLPDDHKRRISLFRVRDSYTNPVAIMTAGKIADHLDSFSPQPLKICQDHGRVNCTTCKLEGKADNAKVFDVSQFTSNDIVVYDSLTQLTSSAFSSAMKKGNLNPFDGEKAEWDQWGLQGAMLERILNSVQNAPCHFVVISHESQVEKEDGTQSLYPTGGTREFTKKVGRYFDHVVRMYKSNGEHKSSSSTTKFNAALAGSRLDIDVTESLLPLYDMESYEKQKSSSGSSSDAKSKFKR